MNPLLEWQELSGGWVLVPRRPIGIIHFLGGAFVATAPHLTYRRLLEALADAGYVIVATPFTNSFDHKEIARQTYRSFEAIRQSLQDSGRLRQRYLPVYGLGHSMGCKLHLLIGSYSQAERAGNMLLSFNNSAAREAIPLMEQVTNALNSGLSTAREKVPLVAEWTDKVTALFMFKGGAEQGATDPSQDLEFKPSPEQTRRLVSQRYPVSRNLLIKFADDTIDQSLELHDLLQPRFPSLVTLRRLPGNHLTPLGPDVRWQAGANFTPLDAIGQWFRQEVYRDLNQLQQELIRWLNPLHAA